MLSEYETKKLKPIEIIEEEAIDLEDKIVIQGFPGMGLVGTIAAHYLVTSLNLKQVGYLVGIEMPPIVVVHQSKPMSPVRIYSNGDFALVVSEIAIPNYAVYSLVKTLLEWYKEKNVKEVVVIGGLGNPDRLNLEELEVFGVSTNEDTRKFLESHDVKILDEGVLVGPLAVTLRESVVSNIPAYGLLSQCFSKFPDPDAAARVLQVLESLVGIKVDLNTLFERAEELKIRMRDLAKRTDQEAEIAEQEAVTAPKSYYS